MAESSQIAEFFKNQTIFITGGSDFIGSLLIEKLLRTCWDLRKIYILVPKTVQNTQQIDDFFNNPCFDLIKTKNIKEKVTLISGNCNQPFLGLTSNDNDILSQETSIILHAGPGFKFEKILEETVTMVRTTCFLLDLARTMPNLKTLLYVSAAYPNSVQSHVKEEFFDPLVKAGTVRTLINSVDDETVAKYRNVVWKKGVRIYVYGTSVVEDLVRSAKLGVPTAIVRLSNVANTTEEPVEGWTDDAYGFMEVAMNSSGFRKFSKKRKVHIVSADCVCNCILAATWKTALKKANTATIYNCVGQQLSVGIFFEIMDYLDLESNPYKRRREPFPMEHFVSMLAAYIDDGILLCLGKPAENVTRVTRLKNASKLHSRVFQRDWTFEENNVVNLWKDMSDVDKQLFKFHRQTDWNTYLRKCYSGGKMYLMRDQLNSDTCDERNTFRRYIVLALFLVCFWLFISFIWRLLVALLL